ncbi:MAG: hypothetical protein ACU0DH_02195 [Paracoccus sp. (in: a-proteobacteria)]|uniref:hypothetical protein n=1 Tax=Paracoccus sp. TaxID=267 RepID=UPI00405A15D3
MRQAHAVARVSLTLPIPMGRKLRRNLGEAGLNGEVTRPRSRPTPPSSSIWHPDDQ